MKSLWKDMKYNADLDCWVVFWSDNTGEKGILCVLRNLFPHAYYLQFL